MVRAAMFFNLFENDFKLFYYKWFANVFNIKNNDIFELKGVIAEVFLRINIKTHSETLRRKNK